MKLELLNIKLVELWIGRYMKLLKHIAIIMDGNRRWAEERGLPKLKGHSEGANNVKRIIAGLKELDVVAVTFWALSTENLKKRSEKELKHLFSLIKKIPEMLKDEISEGARLRILGDISKLPEDVRKVLVDTEEKTKENDQITVSLAINYGGHDEIRRAFDKIQKDEKNIGDLSDEEIESYLDTAGLPAVDLIIRTGGNSRLSGFLPWQSDYAELYFTDTKWPDFDGDKLKEALKWFSDQKRNWGK